MMLAYFGFVVALALGLYVAFLGIRGVQLMFVVRHMSDEFPVEILALTIIALAVATFLLAGAVHYAPFQLTLVAKS